MFFYIFLLIIVTFIILCRMITMVPLVEHVTVKTSVRTIYGDYQPPPPICIVVICNNRVDLLKKTLKSIMDANGFSDNGINNLFFSQSGNNSAVSGILSDFHPNVFKHIDTDPKNTRRLARHFKWTFNELFNNTNCNGFVVIEDDLEMSPDFIDYFQTIMPLLENDTTLITASLWNDVGFKHNTHDKTVVKRTDFFPGLGWYLSRPIWENILGPGWPDQDWDWYVRDRALKLEMDSLIPEVPRDFHVATTGTYMTRTLFDKYFKNININRDSMFMWDPANVHDVSPQSSYEDKIKHDINGATHLMTNFNNILDNTGVVVAWVKDFGKVMNKGHVRAECRAFLRETGIWGREPERGRWRGINHMWSQRLSAYLYIVDMGIFKSGFVHYLKPPNVNVFNGLEICNTIKY
jgi:hypothetical protein